MKLSTLLAAFLGGATVIHSFSIRSISYRKDAISQREAKPEIEVLHAPLNKRFDEELLSYLEKRRGGGGSGGGGGRGGSSGSSSSGSSSSGSSGSSGSSSGSSSGAGKSGSSGGSGGSRNTGTASSSSAARPAYGGGRYYGGGSTSAYRSGGRSPGGILPFALAGAALAIFPGIWLYNAYEYNYNHPYNFHNQSDPNSKNQSLPVVCLCQQYSACGCDDNNNSTFLDSVVGNGSSADENNTLVHIGNVNGTKTIILNGTLPNGTDNSTSSSSSSSGASRNYMLENAGFWLAGAIVSATIWFL